MKKLITLIVAALALSSCGFEIVDPGYRGIETNLGKVVGEPLPEGLHWYNPFTSDIKEFNVRQDTWESKSAIFTKDNQSVDITFAVTYAPEPSAVNKIYKEIGLEDSLRTKVIRPTILGILQNEIGKIVADDVNQKKSEIAAITKDALIEALAVKNVIIYDLQFIDTDFKDAYEHAAEQKVVATQEAQKAKNDTVRIEEQAKQTIATARAEAEAMRIKSQALAQNKGLVQFEIAQKWDGKLPVYMMGSSIPLLDLKGIKGNE